MTGIPQTIVSNAYGTKVVIFDPQHNTHFLLHGTTVHGIQSRDPAKAGEPLAYAHRTGPAGDVFAVLDEQEAVQVGIIGLGVGSMAAYARPRDQFTFYELDPDVVRIAQDPASFTFLRDCRGTVNVVTGDGPAMLKEVADGSYDLIVMDAFDSDCTPEHLYSREAMDLYRRKLTAGGLAVFNISNVHVDLRAIISVTSADMGLTALQRADVNVSEAERAAGKRPSIYLAVSDNPVRVRMLSSIHHWDVVTAPDKPHQNMRRPGSP